MVRNEAVTGFPVLMVNRTSGLPVTIGVVSGFVILDGGVQAPLTNAPVHIGNGSWAVDLTAAETDAIVVHLSFTHADAVPVGFTIFTVPPSGAGLPAPFAFVTGELTTGKNVTIDLYDEDGVAVGLDSDMCTEIGVTGRYIWKTSNITAFPATPTQYTWIMRDDAVPSMRDFGDVIIGEDLGGMIEDILEDTDRVDGLIEDDGMGNDRFTTKALEQGPGGGGGATAKELWEYVFTGGEPPGSAAVLLTTAATGGVGVLDQLVIPLSKSRNELLQANVDVADRIAGKGNIVAASSYVICYSNKDEDVTSAILQSHTFNADSVDLSLRRGAYVDAPYTVLIMIWMDTNVWVRVECQLVLRRAT